MNGCCGAALAVCLITVWVTINASDSISPFPGQSIYTCAYKKCHGDRKCRLVIIRNIVYAQCLRLSDIPQETCAPTGYPLLKVKIVEQSIKRKIEYEVWRTDEHSPCPNPKFRPYNGLCCADTGACKEPKDPGRCKASIQRYYYDYQKKKCLAFIYGGCGGNFNNFLSLDKCQKACAGTVDRCPKVPYYQIGPKKCPGVRCENDDDCRPGLICCQAKCGYKTCTAVRPLRTCASIRCKPGYVCVKTSKGPDCIKGCKTPSGKVLRIGEKITKPGSVCVCINDKKTGGGVLDCHCVLPNGDLLSPGEKNNDPCKPCVCDKKSVTPFCAIMDCFIPPACDKVVTPKGKCCPVCIDKPGLCPFLSIPHPRQDIEEEDCDTPCETDQDCQGIMKCCQRRISSRNCKTCTVPMLS